ncbi:MAG: class I SAM-dependent methyltransferase, partial [Treponema sp.]|nr:class I SAM-dependent methyltransferase [Treponema sp.]
MSNPPLKTWSTPVTAGERRPVPCTICGGNAFTPYFTCGDCGFSYVRCGQCGLVQINPQPDPAEVASRYGSRYGKDYLSYELENEAAFFRLQDLALRDAGFFDVEKRNGPGRVLD